MSTAVGPETSSIFSRVASAVFYGLISVLIVFVNKILLTNFRFPSFLFVGVGQMTATIVILFLAKLFRIVQFPSLDSSIPRKLMPLPILYFFNLITGLGGTKMINLPMFTVLRRFSILMTMILEFYILGVKASRAVKISVGLMIGGSFIAAIYDLSFDTIGYTMIFINNICTAALGVYTKQKLDAKDLGKYGLMYYNCLFMVLPAICVTKYTGDLDKAMQFIASDEMTSSVWLCFLLSCVCGFILNYSLVLCTHHNSALTTTCVGPIKNLFVTYAGMFSSGDYVFSWANFIGINVSVFGSILYTYVTFRSKNSNNAYKPLPTSSLPTGVHKSKNVV
ncbi:unnamed protein product [Caenorhabditis bovis]|uniref:Sugar phosphate transporter domain-containing protein n=1 Tax=Caenorhabditis bovis TaxID=2654633 RepID=A0A8S1ET86_9PELO|nr:unnamed protein product [Caenorhabditis bovis]